MKTPDTQNFHPAIEVQRDGCTYSIYPPETILAAHGGILGLQRETRRKLVAFDDEDAKQLEQVDVEPATGVLRSAIEILNTHGAYEDSLKSAERLMPIDLDWYWNWHNGAVVNYFTVLVRDEHQKAVGVITFEKGPDGSGEIDRVAFDPKFRHKGMATKGVKIAIAYMKKELACTRIRAYPGSKQGLELITRCGFVPDLAPDKEGNDQKIGYELDSHVAETIAAEVNHEAIHEAAEE